MKKNRSISKLILPFLKIRKQRRTDNTISKCGHDDEAYYANGMCKNCYHAKGRTKKASKCEHKDRTLYAKGICKNCYLSIYHKKKRSAQRVNPCIDSHGKKSNKS